jgi:hypothetical protein
MAFDLSTATPVSSGFDLSTAVPVTAEPSAEGMPAPRSLSQRLSMAKTGRQGPEVNSAGEAAAAFGRGALKGTFGAVGDVAGALSDYSPATLLGITPKGLTEPYIPTGEKVGEMFNLGQTPPQYGGYELMGNLVGPGAISESAGLVARGGNILLNKIGDTVFTGMGLNKLSKAVGNTGPDLLNALRRNRELVGVESGPEAMAGERNVAISKMAAPYERELPQVYEDIATKKAELLKGQAARAEASITSDAQKIASDIAAPDVQKTGQNLIDIAEKEKKLSQKTVIGPKFKAAEELGNGVGSDISGLLNKAGELIDTIDPDAAAVLSRKLNKFQGETTTPEFMGPGGATYKGKPVTAAPTATLEDIGDIRTAINDAAAKALAAGSDGDYGRLMKLHDEVTNAVKNSKTLSPEAKNAYFDAVETYKTEHAPRFKTGLQVNLFKINKGENGITASNVINKFFKDADTTDNFVALFGKNPSAMSEAQKGMEGLFRDSVIKDGVIDPKKYTKFMEDYGPQIDKLDATGLNIRGKLDAVVADTKTALAPKATIEEVKKAGGGTTLPSGAKTTEIMTDVNDALQKLPAADIDAVAEIARRAQAYADIKSPATPIGGVEKPQFLNTAKRAVSEIYAALAQKLGDRQALRISELFSTPQGTQAFIETALKYKAAKNARGASTTAGIAANTNALNQLAPASTTINALSEQRR